MELLQKRVNEKKEAKMTIDSEEPKELTDLEGLLYSLEEENRKLLDSLAEVFLANEKLAYPASQRTEEATKLIEKEKSYTIIQKIKNELDLYASLNAALHDEVRKLKVTI